MRPEPLNHWPRAFVAPLWFWLGGLAGGSYLLGYASGLFLPEETAAPHRTLGAVAGLLAVTAGAAILTAELSRPSRMWRLLVLIKWTSPLSLGVFILTGFAACAAVASLAALGGPVPPVLRATVEAAGALLAAGLAAYTGLLLIGSARPVWNASLLPGPLFLTLGLASGGGLHLSAAPWLDAGAPAPIAASGALLALGVALFTAAWILRVRRRLGPAHPRLILLSRGRLAPALFGGLLFGALLPLALLGPVLLGGQPLVPALAGGSLLAGGLALRFAAFNVEIEKR
jgi:formate-dependent nitrite reductase membrane component NrfD